jgi:glutaconate CoA-transferase subunit A
MPLWIDSVEELAQMVEDDTSIAIGGTLFTRVPVQLLTALCDARVKALHYISWGGGFPLEMLLEAGAVAKATLCFSSLDVFGQAQRFRASVETGALELVELSAHALHQGLWAGRRRLPFEPITWPSGSDLVELEGFPQRMLGQPTVGLVNAIRPDYLLLHAQSADCDGNVEIVGARGLDIVSFSAAKRVLVTVDEVVDRERLGSNRYSFIVPRHFVSAITVVDGGAYPTSSLPHYTADYEALLDWASAASPIAAARSMTRHPRTTTSALTFRQCIDAVVEWRDQSPGAHSRGLATIDEWMTVILARMYSNDSICSVGAVSPLATASYLLAKATSSPKLTLITNGGAYIDVASRPLLLALSEWVDLQSSIAHMGGDESYELYYQAGIVTHEVVSSAQVDSRGRTNNRIVQSPSGRSIRLPGQGGMADVANMHQHFVLYLPRQSKLNTPESVDFNTASRTLNTADERLQRGYQPGFVRLITNLALFELDTRENRLVMRGRYPWVTHNEVVENTGWVVSRDEFDAAEILGEPTSFELDALRRDVDPLGVRRLEFVPAKEREPLLRELVAAETDVLRRARANRSATGERFE